MALRKALGEETAGIQANSAAPAPESVTRSLKLMSRSTVRAALQLPGLARISLNLFALQRFGASSVELARSLRRGPRKARSLCLKALEHGSGLRAALLDAKKAKKVRDVSG